MFSLFEEDTSQLLNVVPEEIWPLIFDKIEDPNDHANLVEASQVLREWLKSRRTIYLFPQVLRILDAQKYFTSKHFKQILKCRLVCSQWRFIINKFLEIRPYHFKLERYVRERPSGDCQTDVAYNTYFRLHKFSTDKLQNEVLPEIAKPFYQNWNPFPSRQVEIIVDWSHPLEAVAERFLENVGHHFWHAFIELGSGVSYTQITKLACMMPNLKSVYLLGPYISWNHPDVPFPTLHKLEMISFSLIPVPIVNKILAANLHINVIQILSKKCEEFQVNSNVERLAISQERFQNLSENLPKLKTLYLTTWIFSPNTTITNLFSKLECYKNTLVELNLQFPIKPSLEADWEKEWRYSEIPWDMPKLERLKINISPDFSLDFILGLKSLQFLHLIVNFRNKKFEPCNEIGHGLGKIKLCCGGHPKKFMECNIWELVPTLKLMFVDLKISDSGGSRIKMYKRC